MVVTKPPLGWNTWNTFEKNINEALIIESVDAIVNNGLKDAGYEYVVIDDIWALKERDENGRLVPDPEKFPHGMKYIADYIHKNGLKFGMYSCAGYMTCAAYPGSFEYEWIDAKTFAEWEVDFLKYDFCFHPVTVNPDILYKRMGLALANCGRDILFSACSWGEDFTPHWIKETGANMWRSTCDIFDTWESIKGIAVSQLDKLELNGHGCFNDMDMLVVGMNGKGHVGLKGCSVEEYRTHFSFWALMASPLMIGCDIRNMDEDTKKILTNKEVIAINQDPSAAMPFVINRDRYFVNQDRKPDEPFYTAERNMYKDFPLIARFMDNGDIAIGVFNFTDAPINRWHMTILPDSLGLPITSGKTLELTDLWTGERLDTFNGTIFLESLDAHCCRMFRAKVVDKKYVTV